MRGWICAVLAVSLAVLAGCVSPQTPVLAAIVIDQKGPVAVGDFNVNSPKTGRASAEGILLVGFGDASIKAAAAQAQITRVHYVDSNCLNVLGIYAKYETIVYGE